MWVGEVGLLYNYTCSLDSWTVALTTPLLMVKDRANPEVLEPETKNKLWALIIKYIYNYKIYL